MRRKQFNAVAEDIWQTGILLQCHQRANIDSLVLNPAFSKHSVTVFNMHLFSLQDSGLYLKELIEPVLTCFNDADSRLRYYACEALYNIVKVARGSVLPHFNVLFNGLSKVIGASFSPYVSKNVGCSCCC